jgi:hypothetical protein
MTESKTIQLEDDRFASTTFFVIKLNPEQGSSLINNKTLTSGLIFFYHFVFCEA